MKKPTLSTKSTPFPDRAVVSTSSGLKKLDDETDKALAANVWQGIQSALSARNELDRQLRDYKALYEMDVSGTMDYPWVGASNVCMPLIPEKVDALLSYVIQRVLVPRLIMVAGRDPKSASMANQVESYKNDEMTQQRNDTTWYAQLIDWLHLSLRDGTAYMEAMWMYKRSKRMRRISNIKLDNLGEPILDEAGNPEREFMFLEDNHVDYDDVMWKVVPLKDLLLIPATASSVNDAVAVARAEYLYESDLMAMVSEDLLDEEKVEMALSYVGNGMSDIPSDRQGDYDKTAGGQIETGIGQGTPSGKNFVNRGPIKIWRVHTRQYDLNNDGWPEDNIVWIHDISQTKLGHCEQSYISPSRPFFEFSPLPRPGEAYGYSVVERLAPISNEINAIINQRNNHANLALDPPLLFDSTAEINDKKMAWGMGQRWPIKKLPSQKLSDVVEFLPVPDVPGSAYQEEQHLISWADKLIGMNGPGAGGSSSRRTTATENKISAAATGTRTDTIAMRFRIAIRALVNFTHALQLQNMEDVRPQEGEAPPVMTREMLSMNYRIDISGSGDPINSDARKQEFLGMFNQLIQLPEFQDPVKRWHLIRALLETFGRADFIQLLGVEEDAQKRGQQQQQQGAEQAQMAKAEQEAKIGMLKAQAGKTGADASKSSADAVKSHVEAQVASHQGATQDGQPQDGTQLPPELQQIMQGLG